MSRWASVDRPALLRRVAWALALSAVVHVALLATIEPLEPDPMPRADWPKVGIFAQKCSSPWVQGWH